MKTIAYITTLMLTLATFTFGQSVINFQTGTSLEVQSGASVCSDTVVMNGTVSGGGSICGLLYTLTAASFIEGFYNAASNFMISDTAKMYLRNAAAPHALVDSAKSVMNSAGVGIFTFSHAVNGANYFIVISHRNSIETWSKTAQTFVSNSLSYNFTTAKTKAYGNNMTQIDASPPRFGIYSGDQNQDGAVNLTDIVNVNNNATAFVNGYASSDMNGDNFTDLTDVVITYNNSNLFVSKISP